MIPDFQDDQDAAPLFMQIPGHPFDNSGYLSSRYLWYLFLFLIPILLWSQLVILLSVFTVFASPWNHLSFSVELPMCPQL